MNKKDTSISQDLAIFQASRTFLFGLAYRMLGSTSDAEDVLQDIFIKWQQYPKQDLINPQAWLTAICTHQCLDLLRSAHKSRTEYIGTWLPEPYAIEEELDTESDYTLSTAFLLVLEKLSAKARAAYLLHDIFDLDYSEVADILHVHQDACRQLVRRARRQLATDPASRYSLPTQHQLTLLEAFKKAIHSHDLKQLTALLSQDIQLAADGGGKVSAVPRPLVQQKAVLRFFERLLFQAWNELSWEMCHLNGGAGFKLYDSNHVCVTVITFSFNPQQQFESIYVLRNPDKLK